MKKNFRKMKKFSLSTLKIGADVEGGLMEDDETVSADDHYPSDARGKQVGAAGYVGCDGCSSTLELRPAPTADPKKLVENINALISHVYHVDRMGIDIAGQEEAYGAHIHFGAEGLSELHDNGDCEELVAVLDEFLGKRLLPLSGRGRNGYDELGQSRTQAHGFEYRTLPACIYHNPRICGIVFELALSLVKELAAGDMSISAGEDGATRAEYVKRIGETKTAAFMNFIRTYERQLDRSDIIKVDGWKKIEPRPVPQLKHEGLRIAKGVDPLAAAYIRSAYRAAGISTSVEITVNTDIDTSSDSYEVATNRSDINGLGENVALQAIEADESRVVLSITKSLLVDADKNPRRYRVLSDIAVAAFEKVRKADAKGRKSEPAEHVVANDLALGSTVRVIMTHPEVGTGLPICEDMKGMVVASAEGEALVLWAKTDPEIPTTCRMAAGESKAWHGASWVNEEMLAAVAKKDAVKIDLDKRRRPIPGPLAVGTKVTRGPDWKWGRQDSGNGIGTVVGYDGDDTSIVRVHWPNDNDNTYRYGCTKNGRRRYDLLPVEAPVPAKRTTVRKEI